MSIPFTPSLFWVDLQMSGLDPLKHRILQFACILTDGKCQKMFQGPHIIIKCDEQHLKTMDQWCTKQFSQQIGHHTSSGLYQSCIESKVSLQQAQTQILQFLQSNGIIPGTLVIAGNSIHQDKLFLFHHMRGLNQFLHYRILDVSSIKIVVNHKLPKLFYKKKNSHRAVDDIIESIEEMKFYLQYAFK